MAWVLLNSDNVVIQKQPDAADGFVEVADTVVCGQVKNKDGAFVNPTKSAEDLLFALREERNSLLYQTDWWGLSDLTMTDAQKKYRQDLRDITKTATSLDNVKWPEKP
tara:strand:- start:43 stop:366 length:324 start_codon:yes stop_codon:yes gene_type:complete